MLRFQGGPGPVLFSSLSWVLVGSPNLATLMRNLIVAFVYRAWDEKWQFQSLGAGRVDYCLAMLRGGVYGTELELAAFHLLFGRSVGLYHSQMGGIQYVWRSPNHPSRRVPDFFHIAGEGRLAHYQPYAYIPADLMADIDCFQAVSWEQGLQMVFEEGVEQQERHQRLLAIEAAEEAAAIAAVEAYEAAAAAAQAAAEEEEEEVESSPSQSPPQSPPSACRQDDDAEPESCRLTSSGRGCRHTLADPNR